MPPSLVPGSSASNKRKKQTTVDDEKLERFSGAIDELRGVVNRVSNTTAKHGLEALEKLIEITNRSREDGDVWLSEEDIIKVTKKFGENDYNAGAFVMLFKLGDNASAARTWIQDLLLEDL
jgi:hypothetical protein